MTGPVTGQVEATGKQTLLFSPTINDFSAKIWKQKLIRHDTRINNSGQQCGKIKSNYFECVWVFKLIWSDFVLTYLNVKGL